MSCFRISLRKKFLPLAAFALVLSLLCAGCAEAPSIPAKTVLATVIAAYPGLPDLRICYSDAAVSDEYYADEDLLAALFGNDGQPPDLAAAEEFALFFAKGQQTVEFAVFKAYTYAATQDLVLLCEKRLMAIKKVNPAALGEIYTVGKYVIYSLLPENQTAKKICRQMLS